MLKISVVITTYNWVSALQHVLEGFRRQQVQPWEILVADDGSRSDTGDLIKAYQHHIPWPLIHVWQLDEGFRAAKIRNQAIARATGDYIVFIDGDCIPLPSFIQQHQALAAPGYFVAGNRVLLSQRFTAKVFAYPQIIAQRTRARDWFFAALRGECNRWHPLCTLSLGKIRTWAPQRWNAARTCNLGAWRADLLRINGFDEAFEGWGHEDADLAMRLIRSGIYHKNGRYATGVLHLWHPQQPRNKEQENLARAHAATRPIHSEKGIDQYLV